MNVLDKRKWTSSSTAVEAAPIAETSGLGTLAPVGESSWKRKRRITNGYSRKKIFRFDILVINLEMEKGIVELKEEE